MSGALPVSAANPAGWTPPHYVDVLEGRFASDAAKSEALDALDEYAGTGGAKPLLLHFHGGLVTADVAKRSAQNINDNLPYPGAPIGSIAFGMYFTWHSGLFNFRERPHYKYPDDPACRPADFQPSRSIFGRSVDIYRNLDARILARTGHGYENALEQFIRAYHPLNLPERWCGMKWSIAQAFTPDPGATGAGHDLSEAGTQFIAKLVPILAGDRAKRRVVIVAQSAGAIYAVAFLKALAAYTKDRSDRKALEGRFDVILTAPAVTFAEFAKSWPDVSPFVANIRIFALTNAREYQDGLTDPAFGALHLVAPNYRHSLLYFVSGALEPVVDTPLLGMQRYWCSPVYQGSGSPVRQVVSDLPVQRFGDYLVWSPTGVFRPGRNASARSHGMFSEDATTWDSIASLMLHGFEPPAAAPLDPCTYYDDHNYDRI